MKKKILIVILIIIVVVVALLVFSFNPLENKIKSGIQVITDDITASLFLDGKYLDKTPYINKKVY